jgi:hypothetical protein
MKLRIITLLLTGSAFTFSGSAQALPVFNAEVSVIGWNGVPDEGSVAKIVKLEHAWRRLDGRNDDGFQVAPFPG